MSTALFETGVRQYREKFEGTVAHISGRSVEAIAKSHGISASALESGLKSNSDDFQKFCHSYAATLMPGRVSCCTYAAVVASIAKHFGVPYKAYACTAMKKNMPSYEKDIAAFNSKRAAGEEHPFFANHVFVSVDGKDYERWGDDTAGIDHLDVVVIAEG